MRRCVGIFVVLMAFVLASCGGVAQKAIEQTTGIQVDQKGETVTFKGEDGQNVVISSQISEELKTFPVPQGFKLDSSGSMMADGDKLSVATWIGTGTLQGVSDFYQKELTAKGWKEESNYTSQDGGMFTFSKNEQEGVTITTSKEDDKITISVMLGKNSQKQDNKPTPATGQPAASARPTTAPEPTAPPDAPRTTDAAALPAEMKGLPVPSGFAVVQDSMVRHSQGGKFSSASAAWFGKTSVQEVGEFYQKELPAKGWTEEQFSSSEDTVFAEFVNEKGGLRLILAVDTTDAGTEVMLAVTKTDE